MAKFTTLHLEAAAEPARSGARHPAPLMSAAIGLLIGLALVAAALLALVPFGR